MSALTSIPYEPCACELSITELKPVRSRIEKLRLELAA